MLMTPWWFVFAGIGGVYLLIAGTFGAPRAKNVGGARNARIVGGLFVLTPLLAWTAGPWAAAGLFWIGVAVATVAILKDPRHRPDHDG